jgi:hypothetical protein
MRCPLLPARQFDVLLLRERDQIAASLEVHIGAPQFGASSRARRAFISAVRSASDRDLWSHHRPRE